ncbi:GNAT family N-acetyltransferase [Microbacterium sp. G2-8]|uniref:GNAT family N-acetyltransferase n=1 Tax=Microbacterium sp. G2-8 TaxID=2842454 RepID=UPI0027E259E5|nr:GNAT family N-acetyltransferase [Microbacterium sp. G2-8]
MNDAFAPSREPIVVREASFPEDGASVSSLLDDYLRRTQVEKAEHGLDARVDELPERYMREVARPAESLSGMRVLVASADGEDCGMVVLSVPTSGASEIKRFWTMPPARGRGVGSALIAEALRMASRPVRLSVWEWREPAIRMYRRLGFVDGAPCDDREGLLCLELA